MNSLARYQASRDSDHPCPDLVSMAERELSAFFNAITQMFGSEQAELSAEDWLRELVDSNVLPASTREWRSFTAKVAARLASRLSIPSLSTEFVSA